MTAKRKKSNFRTWLIWLLIVIAILIAVGLYFRNKNASKGIEVDLGKVENRDIKETVSGSGRIYPEIEVIISSDVSGEIVELYVEEGDSVQFGQLLLKIDPEAYESAVERGQANLDNSKAQLAMARAQIQTGMAQKEELVTQLVQARRVYDRNKKLFDQDIIPQSDYEESLAQVESLEASIRSADANIEASKESAMGSQFMVKSSEASLKELKTNLSRTTIEAPTNGIISSLSVEKGERVVGTAQMAGTEIMRISDLNTMEAQVEISENDILKVALNDQAEIEVDAYIDRKFIGIVTEIANSAANVASGTNQSLNTDQVTNFIVKIRVDPESYDDLIEPNKPFPFRPGMSASVDIITDVQEDVLSVPIQAVAMRLDKDKEEEGEEVYNEVVFLYSADTASMVKVETGIQDDEYIYVTEGLSGGEQIVVGPYSVLSKELEGGSKITEKEDKKGDKKDD